MGCINAFSNIIKAVSNYETIGIGKLSQSKYSDMLKARQTGPDLTEKEMQCP